jgi:formiminotetrahydrofolate cyclodeaminase
VLLINYSIEEFSQELGSDSPAPGGGSVSALSGALGADLLSMVCSLSIGNDKYADFEAVIKESHEKVQVLSKRLLQRVDLDAEAFNSVIAAFKMPKNTEEEKKARKDAIQAGFKEAVQSPLSIAGECVEVLRVAEKLIGKFNTNAMSDFGVAGGQAQTGLEGAVMNVRINLPSIKDESYVTEIKRKVDGLLKEGTTIKDKIYTYVQENIG